MSRNRPDPAFHDAHSLSPTKRVGSIKYVSHHDGSSSSLFSFSSSSFNNEFSYPYNNNDSIGNMSSNNNGPTKLTYGQRRALEKEEEEFAKHFRLFDDKPEIQYLHSREDDRLAASMFRDAKVSPSHVDRRGGTSDSSTGSEKPRTVSGYDFDTLLKNEGF